MSTLYELFDQITPTFSVGHTALQMLVQQTQDQSSYVVYIPSSFSWVYAANKGQVLAGMTAGRAVDPGWYGIDMRVTLPEPDQVATCEVCGWFFSVEHGYYEPGEYAYCADCCNW